MPRAKATTSSSTPAALPTEVVTFEPIAVKIGTAAKMLDCGSTSVRELIKAGKLDTTDIFSDKRVIVASIKRLAASGVNLADSSAQTSMQS